jgi:hypothetical protein
MAHKKKARKKAASSSRMSEAEKFFYEHGGYSYDPEKETREQGRRRMARDAARAMQIALEHGWEFKWEEDPEHVRPRFYVYEGGQTHVVT